VIRTVAFGVVRYGDRQVLTGLTRIERASLGAARPAERAAAVAAVKQAACRLRPQWSADELEVLRREHAGPLLRVCGAITPIRVSVAHSDGLALAVVTAAGAV
jgi:hypothetical protein